MTKKTIILNDGTEKKVDSNSTEYREHMMKLFVAQHHVFVGNMEKNSSKEQSDNMKYAQSLIS